MKTKLYFIFLITLLMDVQSISAQAPLGFNYQAVVRDTDGLILSEQSVMFRISLMQSGTIFFSETHHLRTNKVGMVSLNIGSGSVITGSLEEVDWSQGGFQVMVEVDPTGGTNYSISGTAALMSVPFAMYSQYSGSSTDDKDSDPTNELQDLHLSGDILLITNKTSPNYIDLSKYYDNTDNQTLSVSDKSVSILGGNTITLPAETDPIFNDSEASKIADAGSQKVITSEEREAINANSAKLNGTPGTVESGKIVIVDDGKDISGFRNLQATMVNATSVNASGTSNMQRATIQEVLHLKPTTYEPQNPAEGEIYYNEDDKKIYCFIDGKWSQLLFANKPTVQTGEISNITSSSADGSVVVSSDGGLDLKDAGLCWSTTEGPTIQDNVVYTNFIQSNFNVHLNNLTFNTTYFVKAFATNRIGTSYGQQISFETSPDVPTVETADITDITTNSAISGGKIIDDGGSPVTAFGVCWSKTENPTINDSKTEDGSGGGTFSSSVTGIVEGTLYYIRAFAINEVGVGYGQQVAFTTNNVVVLPTVITSSFFNVYDNSASVKGNITDGGYGVISTRGICWSTLKDPTINDNVIPNGGGIGEYICEMTGLKPNTKYYIRAFATNEAGTSYGISIEISTYDSTFVDIRDNNKYPVVSIGEQVWMARNLMFLPEVSDPSDMSTIFQKFYVYDNVGNSTSDAKELNAYKEYGVLYNYQSALISCPEGWHLPTKQEVQALVNFAGGIENAGEKMKTQYGWYENKNGSNESRFSALPGGLLFENGYYGLKTEAYFWTSSEESNVRAFKYDLTYNLDNVDIAHFPSDWAMSVRCLQGVSPDVLPKVNTGEVSNISSNSADCSADVIDDGGSEVIERGVCWSLSSLPTVNDFIKSSGSGLGAFIVSLTELVENNRYYVRAYAKNENGYSYGQTTILIPKEIVSGSFTDTRDNKVYKWVEINDQIWMAENLAYLPQLNSKDEASSIEPMYYVRCNDCNTIVEAKQSQGFKDYGVYYNGPAAGSACPEGWHLPNDSEWQQLESNLGLDSEDLDQVDWRNSGEIGVRLKSIEGWNNSGNGKDLDGFNAVPAGWHQIFSFSATGWCAMFHFAAGNDQETSGRRSLMDEQTGIRREFVGGNISVRCIKDE